MPSRHVIRNMSHGGLRPNTLLVGHKPESLRESRKKKQFVCLKLDYQSGGGGGGVNRHSKKAASTIAGS